jgi:hypothetical protein
LQDSSRDCDAHTGVVGGNVHDGRPAAGGCELHSFLFVLPPRVAEKAGLLRAFVIDGIVGGAQAPFEDHACALVRVRLCVCVRVCVCVCEGGTRLAVASSCPASSRRWRARPRVRPGGSEMGPTVGCRRWLGRRRLHHHHPGNIIPTVEDSRGLASKGEPGEKCKAVRDRARPGRHFEEEMERPSRIGGGRCNWPRAGRV